MRVPVLGDFGQEDLLPGPAGLNLTILDPSYGGTATAYMPWWTFGFGRKRIPVTVRVTNNTPSSQVTLSFSLVSGVISLISPSMEKVTKDLPTGSTADYTIDIELIEDTRGRMPAILTAVADAGMTTTSTVSNIRLDVPA